MERKLIKPGIYLQLALLAFLPAAAHAGEREESFLRTKMIPLAQEFIKRNELPTADFGTNNIKKYRVNFFTDGRVGCLAYVKLETGCLFDIRSDGTNAEVHDFNDGKTITYYDLEGAPKEKVEAVRALVLANKLNKQSAAELAKKFFNLQGHDGANFHEPEIHQCYWVRGQAGEAVTGGTDPGGPLPYYEIRWYRKDVTKEKRESGLSVPEVVIEVSGVTSNLISYHKYGYLPINRDF